jgi:tRNA G18 (ribose-2'-O)-methylase SpoU
MFVWLHNIRSAHNVGTILRTADALGNVTVVLSGYTPRLLDKYGLSNKKLLKVSLGAEESVPVLEFDEKEDFLNYLVSKNKSLNIQDSGGLQGNDFISCLV